MKRVKIFKWIRWGIINAASVSADEAVEVAETALSEIELLKLSAKFEPDRLWHRSEGVWEPISAIA